MSRDKTIKIDIRISEREAIRLGELMRSNNWNRSEALRFLLNFGYVVLSMVPAMVMEAFVDSAEEEICDNYPDK